MNIVLQALAAPKRRSILASLRGGERTAGEIHRAVGGVTFGAVSQHLKVLAEADLVSVRRQGRCRIYRAQPEALRPLREWLESMWDDALEDLAQLAEAEAAAIGSNASRRRPPSSARTRVGTRRPR